MYPTPIRLGADVLRVGLLLDNSAWRLRLEGSVRAIFTAYHLFHQLELGVLYVVQILQGDRTHSFTLLHSSDFTMFAAGLLIIVLAFFAPLQSLARPAPRSDTLVIRFNVIDPRPYPGTGPRITRCIAGDCPRDLVQRRAHGKGGADGQDANGQDGQDGQDAVGQNGGVAIGGDANGQDAVGQDGGDATGTGTGNNDNQVVSVGGHTIVIQNGQIVSVDGQPVGGSGANGQDGSASGGQAGSAGQGGSASGGQAVAGKGEIGGQDGVATPGKRGVVLP